MSDFWRKATCVHAEADQVVAPDDPDSRLCTHCGAQFHTKLRLEDLQRAAEAVAGRPMPELGIKEPPYTSTGNTDGDNDG